MPKVSVVMPVYNGEAFLFDSISSMLCQTYADFELVIIDDASHDGSGEMVSRFSDRRIVYRRLAENGGSAIATNEGHRLAGGTYIAHMDQDDVAPPDRLQKQAEFLERHRTVTVLGGMMSLFGQGAGEARVPLRDGEIKAGLLAGIGHVYNPTVMFRRGFSQRHGLHFRPALKQAADWGYFAEVLLCGGRFANIDAVLLRHRIHARQQSQSVPAVDAELSVMRARILALFYPCLSGRECAALAPLLQWIAPSPLTRDALTDGLEVLAKAYAWKKRSAAGEDRKALDRYLGACRRRAEAALAQTRTV
ncbi:glycosyltransferase family 2 protein [Martelella radicis]|uniref:Glycosyltransferase involved in cell wall biosynthesis n=1 Tax=Martelella radicis TaxID=1397476 RepID=A0A7W6KLM9_9HYPH|nr:glycosyltransferase family A protein [Martelella radicis]MBB4123452.1 glycosyltransferase involved in cell wall biosynthesis [Martelella radicis]